MISALRFQTQCTCSFINQPVLFIVAYPIFLLLFSSWLLGSGEAEPSPKQHRSTEAIFNSTQIENGLGLLALSLSFLRAMKKDLKDVVL